VEFSNLELTTGPPLLNGAGGTAILATLSLLSPGVTTDNDQGIWFGDHDTLELVARKGSQPPGTATGVACWVINSPVLSDGGKIAFDAMLTGPAVTTSNDRGVWAGTAGNLALVARSGTPAPDTSSGVTFQGFSTPVVNSAGHLAFRAGLVGGGVNAGNNAGVWSTRSGSLDLVVRTGDPAPGAPAGAVFSQFVSNVINDAGQIALWARLVGGGFGNDDEGIWIEDFGDMQWIAQEGRHAPGTPDGVNFNTFTFPTLNAAGQVAFEATLAGSGVAGSNNLGIWATGPAGRLRLIAREGDLLEVAPSVFRTIETLSFLGNSGNGDGRPSGFNDYGQVAFAAIFTDGSQGVFVSDLVAIAEPHTFALVGVMLATCFLSARRRRGR
jgi:hypothetical protein